MSTFEIPLTPSPQRFNISLNGVEYQLTFMWNNVNGSWILDIADNTGAVILSGVPLITGADLLAQYGYLNFGGQLRVTTDNSPNAVPTYANLGINGHLYFVQQ